MILSRKIRLGSLEVQFLLVGHWRMRNSVTVGQKEKLPKETMVLPLVPGP